MQFVRELHDTLERTAVVAPAGLGVFWIFQLDPSHRSARATVAPEPLRLNPTAVQAALLVQDTALRWPVGWLGLAVCCSDHPELAIALDNTGISLLGEPPAEVCAATTPNAPIINPTAAPTTRAVPTLPARRLLGPRSLATACFAIA